MSKVLAYDFSYSFNGKIWKTIPDPEYERLAIEVRDNDRHQANFNVIDLQRKTILLEQLVLPEPWWVSLAAIRQSLLFVHVFPDEQDPGRNNLIVYDFDKKIIRLTAEDMEYRAYRHDKIAVIHKERETRKSCTIDIDSGAINFLDEPDTRQAETMTDNLTDSSLFYPAHYTEGDEHFRTVREFLARSQIYPVKTLEYLEYRDYIIVNYFVPDSQTLLSYLLIFDRDGNIIFHEKTGSGLSGAGLDNFFLMAGHLISMSDTKGIVVMDLN